MSFLGAGFGPGTGARASYVFYGTQSAFLAGAAAAGLPATTQTFDALPNLAPFPAPATIDGVTYAVPAGSPANVAYEVVGGNFWPAESGANVLVLGAGFVPAVLAFGGGHVGAFGVALSAPASVGASSPLLYQVELFEADGARHDILVRFVAPGLQYLGFVETPGSPGIAELGLIVLPGGNAPALDDVSHSAVVPGSFAPVAPVALPGPASVVLLGAGLAGVLGLGRAISPPSPVSTAARPGGRAGGR
jgi:hypothetical protein